MTEPEIIKFDFASPSPIAGGNADQLGEWLDQFTPLFRERWLTVSGLEVTCEFKTDMAVSFKSAKTRLNKYMLAHQFEIADSNNPCLLVAESKALKKLVGSVIGVEEEEDGPETILTGIELGMAELFFQELVMSLADAWQNVDPIQLKSVGWESQPHRSKLYAPKQLMLEIQLELTFGEHTFPIRWLSKQSTIEEMFGQSFIDSTHEQIRSMATIENRIRDAKVRISVTLGNSILRLSDLAKISKGDVVKLDQKISDPVSVNVQNQTKFLAWPGRHGDQQAVKIAKHV